jgi:biotin carboxylase
MRAAHNDISLVKGYHTARSEAEKAFGNSGVYIEKFIENPHHIEFQILGDNRNNIIHLGRARLLDPAPQSKGRRRKPVSPLGAQAQGASEDDGQGSRENR